MKVKELKELLDKYNDEDDLFFELIGETPQGVRDLFPMSLVQGYYSDNKEVTIEFEDN